jgi:hypothetical protein
MCSTTDEWLGRICQAIDELADTALTDAALADTAQPGGRAENDAAASAARLAAIWGMVADANPELAKRLPGYLSAAE